MRLRRSQALVVTLSGATPVIHNFITRQNAWCYGFGFDLLCRADRWNEPHILLAAWPGIDERFASAWISYLLQSGALVAEGTPAAGVDAEYEGFWQWGATAGFYHFALKDPPFMTAPQAANWMETIGTSQPPVPLYTTNRNFAVTEKLPMPEFEADGLMAIMSRRRSVRSFIREEISREALRDCLFAGFGITGFLDTRIPEPQAAAQDDAFRRRAKSI